MNKKTSGGILSKQLLSMAELTKLDDARRNHSSEIVSSYQQSSKKKSDFLDQTILSPVLASNSSLPPGRSTIDAQTYVDAQSNGLSSRIIRYYEESNKKPKINNRMYKRPGDFPIVHLDKPKLVLTPKRSVANPPKIARIGQPDPSTYRTNIRAEILRNGTLMPQNSVDRREDADSALARVDPLDALKEISRKRIHCEDTVNQKQTGLTEKDSTDSITPGTNFSNSKRQRITIPSNSPSETNKKSHINSKSNEIFSSLSSSSHLISPSSTPLKRGEDSSPSNKTISPQAKRLQSDRSIEPPIIETTAKSVTKASDVLGIDVTESRPTEPTRPKLTLFNRPYSASVLPAVNLTDRNDECNNTGITFVKPRPMTERSRESVENWLKLKPVEKKRLSLMLSCLSGELDDSDTIDGKEKIKEKINEPPISTTTKPNLPSDCLLKEPVDKDDMSVSNNTISVSSTAQITLDSTTSSLSTKPAIEFTPLATSLTSTAATETVAENKTTSKVAPAIEERKGGFSFPISTNSTLAVTASSAVSATITSSSVTTLTPVLPTSKLTPLTNTTSEPSTDSTPSVTYTFQIPKNATSSAVPSTTEPSKTFSFGNTSTTNESKAIPTFGLSTSANLTQTQSVVTALSVEPKKTSSIPAFGQTISTGTVQFPKPISSTPLSLAATSATPIFGTSGNSNSSSFVLNKQPPSFGSISTTEKSLSNEKPIPSNKTSFATNEQTSIFGSALSNNSTSNAQNHLDPRISNEVTTSFMSNQPLKPTSTAAAPTTTASAPFTFGTSASVAQPTSASSTFGVSKPINSSTNIFGSGSLSSQVSTTNPMFGAGASTKTNLFDQTPKINSNNNASVQNPIDKTAVTSQNIFGSSVAKPSTFSFSGNNQPNATNIFGSQPAATTGSAFNFGGSSNPKSDPSTGSSSDKNKSFSFGGNGGETAKPVFGSKSSAGTFGSTNTNDPAKTFGFTSNNQTGATNMFNNKTTNEVPKVYSFGGNGNTSAVGGTSNTVPFGNSSGSTAFAGSTAFGSAGESFGGITSTPSFGSKSITSATQSFGGASATPTFGSTNSQMLPNANPTFGGTFGGTVVTPNFGGANPTPTFGSANATPTFGSANATPKFGSTNATSTFGSANATPTFGGANPTPTFSSANATPTFGGSSTNLPFGGSNSNPTFGGSNTNPTFGGSNTNPTFGGSNTNPTFGGSNVNPTFGGANATPTFGSSSAFGGTNATPTFGGSSSATPTFGPGQPFSGNISAPSFGGTTNLNSTGSFGGNTGTPAFTTSTGTADVNKTFNFTGSDPTPSPIPNLFNIGPGNSAPRGRTIRTATRRNYR